MFSRLRRLMCGRSVTFREFRGYFLGLGPPRIAPYMIENELAIVARQKVFAEYKPRGA